ncbi:uncharacterized protein LOC142225965 isoform X6 [Haematobia irritans]|uniref:uncharacterized protein LOC142225965 isoform X6 n=1 Tax=Haematobia irritans TaxID=7368 RepID=UPI003F509FC1
MSEDQDQPRRSSRRTQGIPPAYLNTYIIEMPTEHSPQKDTTGKVSKSQCPPGANTQNVSKNNTPSAKNYPTVTSSPTRENRELKKQMDQLQRQMQAMETNYITSTQQMQAQLTATLQQMQSLVNNQQSNTTTPSMSQPISQNPPPLAQQPLTSSASEISYAQNYVPHKKIYPLPIFTGLPEEWQTFFEAYESTTSEFGYTNLHNIMRLRDSIKGRARETVESLLSHSANVNTIMEILKETYGRPEQLVRSQIEKVRAIPPLANDNLDSIVNFANKISNMTTFLKNAKASTSTGRRQTSSNNTQSRKYAYTAVNQKCFVCEVPLQVPRMLTDSGPFIAMTRLGAIIYGPFPGEKTSLIKRGLHIHRRFDENENQLLQQMHKLMSGYFDIETLGVKVTTETLRSKDDERAIMLLKKNTKKIHERYECSLLWKEYVPPIPDSYQMALNRLYSVEKKMSKDREFAMQYYDKINDYIKKGYARKLSKQEIENGGSRIFYLPHFGVKNPNKKGIRLVFDAAAETNQFSLNKALLQGPDINNSLISILLKFREAPVAVCGDIQEMFHQISISKEDQNSQRFLWRDDKEKPVETYVMQRLIFGATCSPTIAQYVKNENAKEFIEEAPRAVHGIVERHYVDDYVDCFQSEEEAILVLKDVIRIHKFGGFHLRNISSNSEAIKRMYGNPTNESNHYDEFLNSNHTERVLGIHWLSQSDVFCFKLILHKVDGDIVNGVTALGIKWLFNTPSNPSEGGVWERLVQSVKKALYIMLKEQAPRLETLQAFLIEAENIVNSRPLTHLPVGPEDPEPLTPNHFLLGCTNSTQTPAPFEPRMLCLRKQWRILQTLKNGMWHQWIREYLPELTRRTKWCLPSQPLEVGCLVFICDVEVSRSQWKRGRVIALHAGKDGVSRSADVRTSTGVLRRPLSKLAVLDVMIDDDAVSESSPGGSVHGGGDVADGHLNVGNKS